MSKKPMEFWGFRDRGDTARFVALCVFGGLCLVCVAVVYAIVLTH